MTPEQIKLIRDYSWKDDGTGGHMAGRLAIVFNNEVCFVDTRDYLIFDDKNQLVHCIRANSEDPISQGLCPYRITTGMYANAQYLEGLYTMRNFKTAIKELFLDTGLINKEQQEEIMKWANSIRNQPLEQKAPGPYFKDTTLPPAGEYQSQVRNDGIHRAAPTNLISYKDRIDQIIKPAIKKSVFKPREWAQDYFEIEVEDFDLKGIAAQMKTIIETFPKNNIQYAGVSTDLTYSQYDTNDTSKFVEHVENLFYNTCVQFSRYHNLSFTLTIDAFNTRKQYFFRVKSTNPLKVEEDQ